MFTNLSYEDKQAFFSLLDEYFSSRPQFTPSGALSSAASTAAHNPHVQAAAHSAISNIAHNPSALRSIASGFSGQGQGQEQREDVGTNVGAGAGAGAGAGRGPPPPVAPRSSLSRGNGLSGATDAGKRASFGGLTSGKSWGGIDTSSGKAAFSSLIKNPIIVSKKEKEAMEAPPRGLAVDTPSTTNPASSLPPPPSRRAGAAVGASSPPPPPVAPRRTAGQQGNFVRALYDYDSSDPNDLSFREGDQINLIEKVSDDWWKGTLDGREGIFPSTYVTEM